MVINPYAGVDWLSCVRIASVSHAHCNKENDLWVYQEYFDKLYAAGIRHMAISNYYPSEPAYPPEEYFTVEEDVIPSPNAEHHHMTNASYLHCNSLGSTFSSGKGRGETPLGVNMTWQWAFMQIVKTLKYKDAGGITINHPTWTGLPLSVVESMLDFTPEVLGIEIFNASSQQSNGTGWAIDMWDLILKTGRRCWGFAVPDHAHKSDPNFQGRNQLLVTEATEHGCLKAYRNGAFYSQIGNTDLTFTNIALNSRTLTVETSGANNIKVITDGTAKLYSGNTCTVTVPTNATYVRIEAASDDDTIYSNPIMFRQYRRRSISNKFILYS